jgi:mRNA interferase MazF
VVPFPFSDLSHATFRPAVVLADAGRGDWILCQVTSNPYEDPRAMKLTRKHFRAGSLRSTSYVRPGKRFTANRDLMSAYIGSLQAESLSGIIDAVVSILRADRPK